jgi:hypothetical protein
MVFLTKINFVLSFDENNRITGFIVYPVKLEWDEDNREQSPVKCEEAEAEAWALSALLHDTGTEWIADFDSKEAADNFATLLQSIYRAGARSHEKDPDAISIVWGYEDVIGQARTHDIIVTPDEARGILQDMKDGHDCNNGITWETINAHVWATEKGMDRQGYFDQCRRRTSGYIHLQLPRGDALPQIRRSTYRMVSKRMEGG